MECPSLVSFLLCIFLFAHDSESACEANGKTYELGETWLEIHPELDCFQHVCLADGTYSSNKCDPAHNDVDVVDTTVSTSYLEKSLTTDNMEDTIEVTTISLLDQDKSLASDNMEDTIEMTTISLLDQDKSLPTTVTNQDILKGCTVEGREVGVGEQVDVPGRCYYRACAGDDQWLMKGCPLIGLSPGWILTPEDASKTYPYCCSRAAPLLDIIPDVVQSLKWSVGLRISYDNNTVDYGNELTPSEVRAEPTVDYIADPDSRFLLCMVDPDAPSRQNATYRAFLHWLVGNIPGSDISSGDVLAEYLGSGPPQHTGVHRYVYLLYKQTGNITFEEPILNNTSVEGIRKFSIAKFSESYNLSDPISLNFFVAQYDDYVPEVHKQLGLL